MKRILADGCALPAGYAYETALEMMNHIGDIDRRLRDDLIYTVLSRWIIKGALFSAQMKGLLLIALDENHLGKGLGEIGDAVFTRTPTARPTGPTPWMNSPDAGKSARTA